MAANSSLDLVGLDFNSIKDNLKAFLKSQDTFKDYDFEGSNLSHVIDVMAYNTFLNTFYLNMVASESFLDTAQMRDSILSHAKELNYLPRSNKSAYTTLVGTGGSNSFDIVTNSTLSALVIPKGTRFSGVSKGVSYNFVTDSVYINNTPEIDTVANTATFAIAGLNVYQGNYQTDTFIVDYTQDNQRFVLTDPSIDTDSITVTVTEDSGGLQLIYTYSSTLLGVSRSDTKYFLQPAENGKYEILFGDNIIGRRPKNNAVVTIQYRVTSGEAGNGVTLFSLDSDVVGSSGGQMITIGEIRGQSFGGSNAETVEQIRFNAPRYFQTQERAVTATDYSILLKKAFPEIQSIAVFGGETFDPPLYGKVYVSVKLKNVDGLPDSKKAEYSNFIHSRAPLAIDTVFITPESLYYKITSDVNYNINVTPQRPDQIKFTVTNAIRSYDASNLNDFNVTMRKSRLVAAIDDSDPSIVSNQTTLEIYKKIVPFLGVSQNIVVRYGVPLFNEGPQLATIHPNRDLATVKSSLFVFQGRSCRLEDDGEGIIRIVYTNLSGYHETVKNVGTVDYDTGTISLIDFNIDNYTGTEIRIYAVPRFQDISVVGNNIFQLGLDELDVTVKAVRL